MPFTEEQEQEQKHKNTGTQEQKHKLNGHEWDKLLSDYIKTVNTPPSTKDLATIPSTKDPVTMLSTTSAKDLVAKLSEIYPGLKFLDSKLPLYGFMQDRDTDDKRMVAQSYLWQGEADAIALYNGKYTIVDFKVVDYISDYWKTKTDLCGKHLHQCLIYARLLQLHMELDYLPPSLIVVIDKFTGFQFYPPLFEDYPQKCKDKLDEEYDWSKEPPPTKALSIRVNKDGRVFSKDKSGIIDPHLLLKDLLNHEATVKDLLDVLGFECLKLIPGTD